MSRIILGLSAAVFLLPTAVLAQSPAKADPLQPLAHATTVQAFVCVLAPDTPFYLSLRLYGPKPAALTGDWKPPPLVPAK